jgi:hypothetical protein
MMTDFMKEATKSFCMPLDIDVQCHKEIRDDDWNVNINDDSGGCGYHHQQPHNQPLSTPRSSSLPQPPPPPSKTTTPVASIHYAPSYEQEDATMDSGEAKFLLTSTCTFCFKRRNRIPRLPHNNDQYIIRQSKPISLRRLNDTLYCNLISDLQSTLKYRSGWFLLFWLPFCLCAALSLLVLVFRSRHEEEEENSNNNNDRDDAIINDYKSSWRTLSMIVIVSFIIGKILYRIKLRNIEDELHIRVQYEWLPLFEQEGFAINYVIDDPGPFYSRKETYIHIYRINRGVGVIDNTAAIRHANDNNLTTCVQFRRSNSLISQDVLVTGADSSSSTGIVPKSIISDGRMALTNQPIPIVGQGNEAKYMVFYPMELARRNVDARQLGYSYLSASSLESPCHCKSKYYCSVGCDDDGRQEDEDRSQASVCYYVTPPTVRDLPNGEEGFLLLHEFLYDIEIMTSPSYTVRMLLFVVLFILFILLCVYAMARHDTYSNSSNRAAAEYYQDKLDGSFALFGFLLLVYICDRFLRLYTNVYCKYYDIASVVEKVWLPQFQLYGYTVTYRIDQPHWYSFREDYIHLYKHM